MRGLLLTLVVTVTVIAIQAGTPHAAPSTSNPGVTVTFGDRAGDAIYSDGHGPYVNGTGGVVGQIYVSGSGDMTLNLSKTFPNRVFNGIFVPATDVTQPASGVPSGGFSDGWFANIGHVWQIPVGATVSTGASFSAGVGDFRWCAPGSFCAGFATTELVTVTRTSFSTWTAETDAASSTTAGTDLDALVKTVKGHWQTLGYYHMPFQLTIQCSNATCQ